MATRARKRPIPDFGRMREGLRGPGIDTRVWIAMARVDDDPDAIRYSPPDGEDGAVGWIVDVTFQGGPLDQDGPVPCRVGASFAGDGALRSDPPSRGCEVAVLIPEGDPNASPTIIAQLSNDDGCPVPGEVNGRTLDEEKALATHVLRTPHGIEEQAGGDITRASDATHRVLGALVELADEDAGQAFVRGNDQLDALNQFLDALNAKLTTESSAFGSILNASTGDGGAAIAAHVTQIASLQAQISAVKSSLQAALSSKVKGE
jgi:hypothetical protein